MKANNNSPAIRFAGFADAWGYCKLKEITTLITKGTTPLDKSNTGDVNFVKIENINNDTGEITITQRISRCEHDTYLRRSQLKENDILFSIAGTLGRVSSVNANILPANTNQALAIVRLKNGNNKYIKTYLKCKAISDFVRKNPTMGAQPNLSLEQVGNLEINLPCEFEQKQISSFFALLDCCISYHQKKYEKLVNLKKAMLDKMFPKNGELVPEVRFSGFSGNWKRRDLGSIMEVTSVKRVHQSDWKSEGVRFLRARDIVAVMKHEEVDEKLYISEDMYNTYTKNSGKVHKGDILVTGVGTIGVPYLVEDEEPLYFKDGNIIWFRNGNIISGAFLYYSFLCDNIQDFIKESAGNSTVGTYTIETGKKTPVRIPNSVEQDKVSQIFCTMERLDNLYKSKLGLLQKLKSAFLEKMFV